MHAIVLAPLKTIHEPLHIQHFQTCAKSREYLFTNLSLAVTIPILKPPNIGRGTDIKSTIDPNQAGGPRQIIGKDLALFKVAITILIFQHRDAA